MTTPSGASATNQLLNSSAIPAELRPLFQAMTELIDGQRAALLLAQTELAQSRKDAAGWQARSELTEKMYRELQHEVMVKPFSAFPDPLAN